MNETTLSLRLKQIRWEAEGICSYELVGTRGELLPEFTAGAHIDLYLPGGMVRSYSLASHQGNRTHYIVAVQREDVGRGGSKWLHDYARVGQIIAVTPPKNEFVLVENGSESIFFAGGIGITPILSMIQRLEALGKPWTLHYATRSREATAYIEELDRLDNGRGRVHYSIGGERAGRLNIKRIVDSSSVEAHFYCCGPTRMIDDFVSTTESHTKEFVHYERFAATSEAATAGGFDVVLAKSGGTVSVAPGQRMLDALLDANVQVPYACSNGICGTCLTAVIKGTPDHRDDFLSDDEKKLGKSIIVCCSGSLTTELVLDL